jgi:hypothetical protein
MKTGFKQPIKIINQEPKDKPDEGKSLGWDFTCPQYDQRTSCFVNAGTKYGVGHRQPVGHHGDPKMHVDMMPIDRYKVDTMEVEKV